MWTPPRAKSCEKLRCEGNNRMSLEPIKAQKNETTTYDCHPIKADTTTYE